MSLENLIQVLDSYTGWPRKKTTESKEQDINTFRGIWQYFEI